MICKKCKQDISGNCSYTNGICVFCYHNITEWDSNGLLVTRYEATNPIICPNCNRIIPNADFRRKHGCSWCVPEKNTPYGNGHY